MHTDFSLDITKSVPESKICQQPLQSRFYAPRRKTARKTQTEILVRYSTTHQVLKPVICSSPTAFAFRLFAQGHSKPHLAPNAAEERGNIWLILYSGLV